MKKLFSVDAASANVSIAVLILRIGVGGLMLTHGIPKLLTLWSGDVQFPSMFGMGPEMSLGMAVFAEVICSVLILIGLGTRLASMPLMFTMLVAVFYIHLGDPFAKQELGLLYLMGYVVLFTLGSGKYSVDYLIQPKNSSR